MAFELRGADELLSDLQRMAAALDADNGAAAKRALQRGAEPIHRRMVQNASGDPKVISGKLRGSIKVGSVKKRRGSGTRITIGIHGRGDAEYGNFVEFGHGGPSPAPPHPFVRPAYDAESNTAYEAMKQELRDAVERRA